MSLYRKLKAAWYFAHNGPKTIIGRKHHDSYEWKNTFVNRLINWKYTEGN